jgi:hypothetical protein
MAIALRPIKPILAAQIAAAVVLDTTDRTARGLGGDPATIRRGTTTFDTVITGFLATSSSATKAAALAD